MGRTTDSCETNLVTTAHIFPIVSDSTLKSRPSKRVKNPAKYGFQIMRLPNSDIPLVLDKIVELATLVKSRLAFTLQLAINQKKQNTDANFAV